MAQEKIDNLVICSTLNQITNYLIIERYKPKRIFNITYDEKARSKMNISMKNEKWDEYLAQEVIKKNKFKDNIELSHSDMYSLIDIKEVLEREILDKANEKVYWHITGGQRTIALAVRELVKERKKDKVMYIEGNSEKLIVSNNCGELITSEDRYECRNLTFEQVLRLTGFDTKKLKSTSILKKKGKTNVKEDDKEYQFYKKLYEIVYSEKKKENKQIYKVDFVEKDEVKNYEGCFRDLLLKSNGIKNSKDKTERQDFTKELFRKLLEEHKELDDIGYYTEICEEFNKSYPAGYIFEKLTAYKIYDLIKGNDKIVGMETSLKTYFIEEKESKTNKKDNIIDELDIVLLTSTGKIINFECKSGGMKGDNAKSHNYTTYRLSGVFGMPILLSPLYYEETTDDFKDKNDELKHQFQALRAAEAAELEVFPIDGIKEGLKKLGIIEEK